MKKTKKIITSYYPDFFSAQNVKTWKEWVEGVKDAEEFDSLLQKKNIADVFKLRAFFCWFFDQNRHLWPYRCLDIPFPTEAYLHSSKALKDCFSDCMMQIVADEKNPLGNWEILKSLPLLSYEKQNTIFAFFTPFDSSRGDEGSWDQAFRYLLESENIPIEFKEKGTGLMQKQVERSWNHKFATASCAFVEAVMRVSDSMPTLFDEGKYSIELLEEQMRLCCQIFSNRKGCEESFVYDSYADKFLPTILNYSEYARYEAAIKPLCLQFFVDLLRCTGITAKTELGGGSFSLCKLVYEKCKPFAASPENLQWLKTLIAHSTEAIEKKQKQEEKNKKSIVQKQKKKQEAFKTMSV